MNQSKEGWEERFYRQFSDSIYNHYGIMKVIDGALVEEVIKFIENEIETDRHQTEQRVAREKEELAEVLIDMYEQYCGDGHHFMSAGERASNVLRRQGYATFDKAGRIKYDTNPDIDDDDGVYPKIDEDLDLLGH